MTGDDQPITNDSGSSQTENHSNCIESLSWTVRLSDGEPKKRFVIIAVAVLAAIVGIVVFRNLLLGLVGFVMIVGSAAEHLFPAKFTLDNNGATTRVGVSVVSMTWGEVKRVYEDGPLLVLSPFAEKSKVDAFRGVRLRVTKENRSDVLELIRKKCGENVRLLEE